MKTKIIPIVSLLLLSACGNPTSNTASVSENDSIANVAASNQNEEAAKAVVEAAYKSYFNPSEDELQTTEDAECTVFAIPYMGKYMSKQLIEQIVMGYNKQNVTDDLFFDYDVWINAQDCDSLSLKGVSIVEYSDDRATAEVNFVNLGQDQKAYVVVEYNKEKDAWFICDFLDPENKTSYVEDLNEYLSE